MRKEKLRIESCQLTFRKNIGRTNILFYKSLFLFLPVQRTGFVLVYY
jgi:hypothetical protein